MTGMRSSGICGNGGFAARGARRGWGRGGGAGRGWGGGWGGRGGGGAAGGGGGGAGRRGAGGGGGGGGAVWGAGGGGAAAPLPAWGCGGGPGGRPAGRGLLRYCWSRRGIGAGRSSRCGGGGNVKESDPGARRRRERARQEGIWRYLTIQDAADPALTGRQRGAVVRRIVTETATDGFGNPRRVSRPTGGRWRPAYPARRLAARTPAPPPGTPPAHPPGPG